MTTCHAIKSSVQSLDCRANSYHIYLNHLDPSAYGIEISQEYPYPKWPINRFLRTAHLLPSNCNLWHSLSGGNPNCASSTHQSSFHRHFPISSSCPHPSRNNGGQLQRPCGSFFFYYFYFDPSGPLRILTVGIFFYFFHSLDLPNSGTTQHTGYSNQPTSPPLPRSNG